MDVLCIDVDSLGRHPSKMPNLALMKISAWHKRKGDAVFLNRGCNPGKVYVSCVFERNREHALSVAKMFNCDVEIGGYGINDNQLPEEIEHSFPDYSLYGVHYSIGYTSRGCIRKCPWCIVPMKEGDIRDRARIDEFYVPAWRKLILYDNNFLASPRWYENLKEIIIRKIKVSFNQGLDIRLIDQENAKLLAKAHLRDDQFRRRRIYYSFDFPQIEEEVLDGIQILKEAGFKPDQQMCYVLVGYNTTYEEDVHRINMLIKEGVKPYVMPYNDRHDSYYPHLERWINHRYYKVVPWEKYESGKSQEIISKLAQFPELFQKFVDLEKRSEKEAPASFSKTNQHTQETSPNKKP